MGKCKTCNEYKENMKTQQKCYNCWKEEKLEKQKQYNSKRGQKIKPVSDKRKQEWKEYSQKDVFEEIKNTRIPKCKICGQWIYEFKSHCFAHLLNKNVYPKYKLRHKNIALVCSQECHKELDKRVSKKSKAIVEQLLLKGESLNL